MVMIPDDWTANERGNILLTNEDAFAAWLLIDENHRLFVRYNPNNYPSISVAINVATVDSLARHIQRNYEGWTADKLNIDGVRTNGSVVASDTGQDADSEDD